MNICHSQVGQFYGLSPLGVLALGDARANLGQVLQSFDLPSVRQVRYPLVARPRTSLRITRQQRPFVVSCGTQQSELLVVVEPGGHVDRLHLSLST